MSDNVIPMPLPAAPSGTGPAGPPMGMPMPGQPMQILLPPQLQEVAMQWPEIVKRLGAFEAKVLALETKPVASGSPNLKLVAAFSFLAGCSGMAFLVWLWFYAAIIFRL